MVEANKVANFHSSHRSEFVEGRRSKYEGGTLTGLADLLLVKYNRIRLTHKGINTLKGLTCNISQQKSSLVCVKM